MPAYLTSLAWTGPIAVAAGDVLQNTGTRSILVCAEDDPEADDSLLIRPRSWYFCAAAMTIRAATHGVGIGCLSIASGLGEDDGVEPVEPTAPGTFAPHQWSVSTGAAPGAVNMDISGRPSTGGAALTALEYTVQDGEDAPGTALAGLGTGQRVLTMPDEDTEYSFRVRARNSVGPGPWSDPQAAVSGAAAELPSLEAIITPNPLVAGEDFEILFSAAPDSVSPLTLVRDADDPRRYTGTAPDSGSLTIGATLADHQALAVTYTYDPAPVIQPGSITVESNGTISPTLPDNSPVFDAQVGNDIVTFDPAEYTPTSKPAVLDTPDIAGTGGNGQALTVTDRALFAGHADAGPITITAGWYRNDTPIGDTDGSYTQDDAVDGDKTLTWRETATNAAGSVTAVSNGILCPAAPAAGWWHPQALVHVDYANDRARINGTTFASIAAAKAANAIKTAGGVDYIDVAGLGASYALSASGIVPNDTATRNMASLDDGTSNNVVAIGQTYSSSTHRSMFWVITAGTGVYTPPTTTTLTHGMALNLSLRVKSAALRRGMNGTGTTSGTAITLPAVNRLVLGNRSAGDRAWTGALYHVLLINADLSDDAVDALPGVA